MKKSKDRDSQCNSAGRGRNRERQDAKSRIARNGKSLTFSLRLTLFGRDTKAKEDEERIGGKFTLL